MIANTALKYIARPKILCILSVYSLSVCSSLYVFICLPEMVNKDEYIEKNDDKRV